VLDDLFKLLNNLFKFCGFVVFGMAILLCIYYPFELISDFLVGEIYLVELIGYSVISIVGIFSSILGLYCIDKYF
jgi:hypothetical protein